MRCPTLAELPSPPPGKTGWPWTEASSHAPDQTRDESECPRVSVVTPSYNQGEFIEETIRSVLLQGYPNLEYIVIDGGSNDGSIEIIRTYAPWLDYWVSEPDQGQVYAIEKGWAKSSGEILAYLNSDDTYLPDGILKAVSALRAMPAAAAVNGGDLIMDRDGIVISERLIPSATWLTLLQFNVIPQPATFVRRQHLEQAGGLNLQFSHAFDFELWTRLVRFGEIISIPEMIAATRWHSSAKTFSLRPEIALELERIVRQALEMPEARQISTHDRRVINATLHLWMATIYFDNFTAYPRQAISNSWLALRYWFPIALQLARYFSGRTRVALLYYFLKYVRRRDVQKVPWGFGRTGVHWSAWRPAPSGTAYAHRD